MQNSITQRIFGITASVTTIVGLFSVIVMAAPARALDLSQLTNLEAGTGLKDALIQGAGAAVGLLGKENGFLGDGRVKIPLPPSVQGAERMLRTFGLGHQADELITRMNRAAEAAVPQAQALLVDSVRQMSLQDAKGILGGPEDAATQYFKRTTASALIERFLPIVSRATAGVQLAETYNSLAGRAAQLGLLKAEDANLDHYVTQKALDGLYFMIAEQEKSIRQNPVGAATAVAKKVFGALGR